MSRPISSSRPRTAAAAASVRAFSSSRDGIGGARLRREALVLLELRAVTSRKAGSKAGCEEPSPPVHIRRAAGCIRRRLPVRHAGIAYEDRFVGSESLTGSDSASAIDEERVLARRARDELVHDARLHPRRSDAPPIVPQVRARRSRPLHRRWPGARPRNLRAPPTTKALPADGTSLSIMKSAPEVEDRCPRALARSLPDSR